MKGGSRKMELPQSTELHTDKEEIRVIKDQIRIYKQKTLKAIGKFREANSKMLLRQKLRTYQHREESSLQELLRNETHDTSTESTTSPKQIAWQQIATKMKDINYGLHSINTKLEVTQRLLRPRSTDCLMSSSPERKPGCCLIF